MDGKFSVNFYTNLRICSGEVGFLNLNSRFNAKITKLKTE